MSDQPPGIAHWIYVYIEFYPGVTARQLAEAFAVQRGRMTGLLAAMDSMGLLLAEDDHGGLYAFTPAEATE